MKRMLLSGGLLALSTALRSSTAHAEESEAERLFREGRVLLLQDRFDEACPKMAESQRLDPHVGTLLNLAACHEKQGKIGTAWVEFQRALTAARAEGQHDRERLAQARIDVLEPRVPWLTIRVEPGAAPEGLVVALDGSALSRVALGKEMPVDPGSHVVTATASDRKPFEEQFSSRESEHRTISVAVLDANTPAPEQKPAPLIVEPAAEQGAAAKANELRPWVLEAGVFVGLVKLEDGIPRVPDTTFGVDFFAGYALSKYADVGARFALGPLVHGGTLVAGGPSAAFHPGGPIRIGASLFLGNAEISGNWTESPPLAAGVTRPRGAGTTNLAAGFGIEIDWRIVELQRGSIDLNLAPFYLLGNYNAWVLPIGVAYRFQ